MSKQINKNPVNRRQASTAAILPAPVISGRKPIRLPAKPVVFLPGKPVDINQLNIAAGMRRSAHARQLPLCQRLCTWLVQCLRQLGRPFGNRFSRQLRTRRKLELQEIQQLGEKRFVALVRAGNHRFLIAGAATSVSLLAEIGAPRASAIPPRLAQESA
jgi:hypothetical protein